MNVIPCSVKKDSLKNLIEYNLANFVLRNTC